MAGENSFEELVLLFATNGASAYLGESITQTEHMTQAGSIAEAAGAIDALVVAALLHDVGHLLRSPDKHGSHPGVDDHAAAGAIWLGRWFGPDVTEPVRLHVDAKRYLCFAEPTYFDTLSAASRDSLVAQGGPMTEENASAFIERSGATGAVALRRWDDRAKSTEWHGPPFAHFAETIERVAKRCDR